MYVNIYVYFTPKFFITFSIRAIRSVESKIQRFGTIKLIRVDVTRGKVICKHKNRPNNGRHLMIQLEIKDIGCRCVEYGNGVAADCFTG